MLCCILHNDYVQTKNKTTHTLIKSLHVLAFHIFIRTCEMYTNAGYSTVMFTLSYNFLSSHFCAVLLTMEVHQLHLCFFLR